MVNELYEAGPSKRPSLDNLSDEDNDVEMNEGVDSDDEGSIHFDEEEQGFFDSDDHEEDENCEIEQVEKRAGMTSEEYISIADIVANTEDNLERNSKVFKAALTNSSDRKIDYILQALKTEEDEDFDDVFASKEDFIDKALKVFEEATNGINNLKAEYILSLSPLTVMKSARSLSVYFEFLLIYCPQESLSGFSLEELKSLEAKERGVRIAELFRHFMNFLRYNYTLHKKSHKKEHLEPSTAHSYCFSLFVAFKIIGLIDYGLKRKDITGLDSVIHLRAAYRNIGRTDPYYKETITPVDLVEFFKVTPLRNLEEIQHCTIMLFMAETGIRIGSTIASNKKDNGHLGILLEDIKFE
uniref:Uncharacterized protein n=1 Tax=Acrobeloides nanus TaxID=290746 RepID=A0A914E4Q2_9BILA